MKKSLTLLCLLMALALVVTAPAFAANDGTIYRQNFGTNATELPLVKEGDDPVTITYWRELSSTVMETWDECLVFQEMEKRTGVHIEFVYPPVGQGRDNFNLRVASNDLPHVFSMPPDNSYPGGLDKAIEDEVYLPLNEYYDAGLTPNYQYLRENYPQIANDTVLDSGAIVRWPMLDYVPSSPWSGLWVRQDWLDECGLELPVTVDDWTNMLRTFKEKYGAVLGCNIKDWYGVATNFNFSSTYDTGYNWIAKEGKTAAFGPAEPGYKDFLALLNSWYAEGLMDPDFGTRTNDDYNTNVANGVYGAFGLAYGELGQAKVTGMSKVPAWKVTAVKSPIATEGQELHLRQFDSIVRSDSEFFTTKLVEDGIDKIAAQWKDYWYSQEGGDLCSYGVEGVTYEWNDDNTLKWIYEDTGIASKAGTMDFWTIYPLMKLHNWGYLRDSTSYEMQPEVWQCIGEWGETDASWFYPDGVSLTADEAEELDKIMADVNTYREEMTLKFITGQESLDNFDAFVEAMEGMDLSTAVEYKQAGLDRYLAR